MLNPRPVRRSLRLQGFDYSSRGAYYVTICTESRVGRFGTIDNGNMVLNGAGQAVQSAWLDIPARFPGVELDEFVVMPDHLHGVLVFTASTAVASPTLGAVVGAFKSLASNACIRGVKNLHWPGFDGRLFQVRYYDHIVRDEFDLDRIREYIELNPMRWDEDKNHPGKTYPSP